MKQDNTVHSRIWEEEAEPDNAFATRSAHCHGYDVYGAMLGNASWAAMLYLMLRGEAPGAAQERLFDTLAMALANPGPRAPSVHAAMCGGVAGSTAAASLIAALSVGAGRSGGARDVYDAMQMWEQCGADLARWNAYQQAPAAAPIEIWPEREHAPGFEPHGVSTSGAVRDLLASLARVGGTPSVLWLNDHVDAAHQAIGSPLAMSGLAACVFVDLGLSPAEGEMLFLLLRLPGAAAHALEQTANGFRRFPFYQMDLQDQPVREAA